MSQGRRGHIYILEAETGHYKIGCTTNLESRLKNFGAKLPFDFSLLEAIEVDDIDYYEKWLHKIFADRRVTGEWFILDYYSLKAIVEYASTQYELDKFIEWYVQNEAEFDPDSKDAPTPGLLYCAENSHPFFLTNEEFIKYKQAQIDAISREIWEAEHPGVT